MQKQIIVYGAGGFAREVAWLASDCGYQVCAFVDDNPEKWGEFLNGVPIMSIEEAKQRWPRVEIIIGVGNPKVRENIVQRLLSDYKDIQFAILVHPQVHCSKWVEVGEGTVITAGNILTTNIRVGRHVHINLDCTIGHDAIIEDFATLAPGVHVSGWVHIKKGAYIGTGAVIINGEPNNPVVIGEESIIGAGAVVTKSIPDFVTAVGVPAKVIKHHQ